VVERTLLESAGTKIEPVLNPRLSNYMRGLIVIALVAGLSLRLIRLHSPPYDNHSFRQCQTLSTLEDFYRNGIDFLHPHAIHMGYPGVYVLELPVFQAIGATLYHFFGPYLELIRILNIAIGALTTFILYRISLLWFDRTIALLGALIYWLAPLNIVYQRSTLFDPMAVLCAMASFYSLALLLTGRESKNAGQFSRAPGENRFRFCFTVFAIATLLTGLMKTLYLWPIVLLFAQEFFARRCRLGWSLLRIAVVFAVTGVCFVVWNRYAASANAANSLSEGVKPTSLLGFSALLKPDFYSFMLKTRPKVWLGLLGALFYLFGLWGWWSERLEGWKNRSFLIVLVPPTYLLAFANINHPHDYYQLIITPFLSIISANGVVWLARKFQWPASEYPVVKQNVLAVAVSVWVAAAVANYVLWLKWPQVDGRQVAFAKLCAGKVEPWAPTILFGTEKATGMGDYLPPFLYAGKLWGYGWVVPDAESAKEKFEVVRAGFERLDYVVFYGTELPKWVPSNEFQLIHQDHAHRFFVFRSKKNFHVATRACQPDERAIESQVRIVTAFGNCRRVIS
jgi:Dolichyl-phosphate-mannose-protein mannosyltransferase